MPTKRDSLSRLTADREKWLAMGQLAERECRTLRALGGSRAECYLLELKSKACADRAERLAGEIAAIGIVTPGPRFSIQRFLRRH